MSMAALAAVWWVYIASMAAWTAWISKGERPRAASASFSDPASTSPQSSPVTKGTPEPSPRPYRPVSVSRRTSTVSPEVISPLATFMGFFKCMVKRRQRIPVILMSSPPAKDRACACGCALPLFDGAAAR